MLKDSVITYVTMVVNLVISTIVAIVVTRTIGIEGKGEISLILSITSLLLLFSTFGAAHSTIYHLGKLKIHISSLIGVNFTLTFLQTLLVMFLSYPLWILGSGTFFKGLSSSLFIIALLMLPFELLLNYNIYMLRGLGKADLYNGIRLLRSFIEAFLLAFTWILGLFTIENIILALFISLFLTTLFSQARLLKFKESKESIRLFDWALVVSILKYGSQLYPSLLLAYLGYRLDLFIVNSLLSNADVGVYSIAVSVAEVVWFIPNAVGVVLFPLVSKMSEGEANSFTPVVSRQVFLLSFLSVLGLSIFARLLLTLGFGEEVSVLATPVLFSLFPGILAFSVLKIIWQDLCGRGKPGYASFSMLAVVVIDVIANYIITPRMGIIGAGFSSSIAYTSATVFIMIVYRKITGIELKKFVTLTGKDYELYKNLLKGFLNRFQKTVIDA